MSHLQYYNLFGTLAAYLLALAKRRIGESDIGETTSSEQSNERKLNLSLPV